MSFRHRWPLYSGGGFPPFPPLEELARIRGAMWPKLNLPQIPWGPRPGQSNNIAMIDYMEVYTPEEQKLMMDAYVGVYRGYNTAPMGPILDNGYHGQIPSTDLSLWPAYLDAAERWWRDYGIRVIHFLRPDEGVWGRAWTVADLDEVLTPLFSSSRAQDIMRIVCLGWEPGGKYGYNNSQFVEWCQWMARVFPNALRCLHLPADEDAPVGPADDGHPNLAGWAWGNVTPYLHVWLVQNGGYAMSGNSTPSPQFRYEFCKQWDIMRVDSLNNRFKTGYGGFPTTSAWNNRGLVVIPAEYAAYGLYWNDFSTADVHTVTDDAFAIGAPGFFDDGGP